MLASSTQPQDEGVARTLDALVGATVADVACSPPAWDLRLTFSSGLVLQVFADQCGPEASPAENWELWAPDCHVSAGPGEAWNEERDARPDDAREEMEEMDEHR